jgi:4-hydroxybenzoyl-CoA thioesterase
MFANRQPIRIAWGDCDPAGIVFYPRYFEYFNACTEALFEAALGQKKREWFDAYGVMLPMVEARARFLVPSRYGDDVIVESQFVKINRKSFEIRHALMRGDALAVEGFDTRVWAGRDPEQPERLRGVPIPDEIVQKLSR